MSHDGALWILQWAFGLYFLGVGVAHFIVPEGLPGLMSWMYELNDTLHVVAGTAEILGGLGLVLPAVTRVQPQLTSLAAVGLLIVMVAAILWHIGRGEFSNLGINVINGAAMAYIAYGRSRLEPIAPR